MPLKEQSKNRATLNKYGFAHLTIDPVVQEFLDLCKAIHPPTVLEVGAAYGHVSSQALQNGAMVWVNDLDERHLKAFIEEAPATLRDRATLVPGDFSDIVLPQEFFDAIVAVRVLHFFPPLKLIDAAKKMLQLLKSGGKVYIVNASPYVKMWKKFIPIYERRKNAGSEFPGYITNSSLYLEHSPSGLYDIPDTIHLLDPITIRRVFESAGFIVKRCEFMARDENYPDEIRFDGREAVGLVAYKP